MKIEVQYQSRGGNTRAVAEIIAARLGIEAKSIDKPLDNYVDILFLGGGVYKWDADTQLKEYLERLDSNKIGQIVAFSTTGTMKTTINRITEYANKAGIRVNKKYLCLRMMLQGHTMLGRKGGNLNDRQVEKIKMFTSKVLENLKNEM
jgi:flavodoxin